MKKFRLKWLPGRILFLVAGLSLVSPILVSCGDDVEGKIEVNNAAPDKVTGIETVQGPGAVTLSWVIPTSPSFMYSKVEYTTSKGEVKYILVSKEKADANGRCSVTVEGFANTDAVTFSIYACSVKGNSLGATEVAVNPGAPAFMEVAKATTVTQDMGGVLVNWKNDYAVKSYIVVNYHAAGDASKSGSCRFEATANSKGRQFVQLAYGDGDFLAGEECVINITAEDVEANSSEAYEFKVTPIMVNRLSREGWSFPGYDESANNPTIGYSSQEAGGEGATPNGRVVAMLDGNLNTFWHASWKTVYKYPHWFIVDMGKDVTVYSVDIAKRQGNDKGQRGHYIYTCPDSKASDKGNPDSWAWEEHGEFPFDHTNNASQISRLSANPTARYIKVYMGQNTEAMATMP